MSQTEPIVVKLTPAPDAWDVARKLSGSRRLIFFDSADRGSKFARYSYIAAEPREWWTFRVGEARDPWAEMTAMLGPRRPVIAGLPPFQGGVAGLFGYGLGRTIERLPAPHFDEFRIPDLAVGLYEWVVSFDHQSGRAWLVSHRDVSETQDVRRRLEEKVPSRFSSVCPETVPLETPQHPLRIAPHVASNFTRIEYESAIRRAIEHIHAGDCYQINLSQRLVTPWAGEPLEFFGRLRAGNPAPFAAFFDLGEQQILSVSPERFLSLSADGEVVTRPIKGTRRRGKSPAEDFALRDDLAVSEKDRAENVMIVDLMRNDLSRVCAVGSVQVPALFELESHPTVHHLVSEVRGRMRPGLGAIDLLRAAFPGGSVTGAPKVRAMELIAELERVARGPYCGSLGWIGFDGAMDTSILIRTMTAAGGWLQFPVGGGIVADSDPAREYEETLHKAEGMLRALEP